MLSGVSPLFPPNDPKNKTLKEGLFMAQLNEQQQYLRMTQTPIPRLVVSMALPTVAGMLVSSIYNITDTYFVSRIGTSASAAVGVVFSLQSLIQAVGFCIGMGSGSMVSRKLGEKDSESASRYVSSAFALALCMGMLLAIFGLSFLKPLLRLLGATETSLPYACDYAKYILMAAPVMCSSFVLNVAMKSEGRATLSTIGLTCGNVLNVILDPILMFPLGLGTAGAAIATAVSQCVSFVLLAIFFFKKQDSMHLRLKYVSRKAQDYATILRVGAPTLLRQGCASIATAMMNGQAAVFGDAAVAAMSIATRIYLFVRSILVGVGQGFQPVAGYNYGAKLPGRVKEAFRFTVLLGTAIAVLATIVIAIFAPQLMMIFRKDDSEVIQIGARALRNLCFVLPVLGYSTYVNQMLQGLGRSGSAAFLASCRQGVFFIPLILILPRLFALPGVQLCQPIADGLTALVSIPFHVWFFTSPDGLAACGKAKQ